MTAALTRAGVGWSDATLRVNAEPVSSPELVSSPEKAAIETVGLYLRSNLSSTSITSLPRGWPTRL